MQWAVDETYHHPLIDADEWKGEWPTKPIATTQPSKKERRRRVLIDEALLACAALGVQLLVLPEYSVRPETVDWIREQLRRRNDMPSVLAGTYKLHGNSSDSGFTEAYEQILGAADFGKVFGGRQTGSTDSLIASGTSQSGEHSAVLTLLTPLSLDGDGGSKVVCCFSRRKKYPSLAAGEIINPAVDAMGPLFSEDRLYDEITSRDANGKRTLSGQGTIVSAKSMLAHLNKTQELQSFAEFICSELFLPMSPVNQHSLAAELLKMATRFGAQMTPAEADASVLEDLRTIARYMGTADGTKTFKRRSILMVPAMTTRSADYWIFGQAALLAGGATTVFCNSAVPDVAVGGSCFIGRNSWSPAKRNVHNDSVITPYGGWSKGIFYSKPTDALGKEEQAVVVADIDPNFMQEGKPRPQALAVPLQLVAYLPILEVQEKRASLFASKIAAGVNLLAKSFANQIATPHAAEYIAMSKAISDELDWTDAKGFAQRFDFWTENWRRNSVAGAPPTLIDWLWVDATQRHERVPSIFVPPWK
jgi:hypothetical protein